MNASSRLCLFVLNLFYSCFSGYAQVVAGPVRGPGGNFYEIIFFPSAADAVKWTKAEALAEERTSVVGAASAHLATITSSEEDVLIEKLRHQVLKAAGLDPHAGNAPPFWVGGFQPNGQSSPSSNWQWVNGGGVVNGIANYTNWRRGEPNDWPDTGVESNQENHLVIGLGGRFTWADMTGNRQGYVVEYEMEPVSEPVQEGWGPSGNFYRVVFPGYNMTWEEAARDAWKYDRFVRGRLPHLATIGSEQEGKYIETLRQGSGIGWENGLWLGGYQRPGQESSSHGWRWVHDEGVVGGTVGGLGYSNWNTGEPNDWPSAEENGGEDYLGLRAGSSLWNDISTPQNGYVAEFEEEPAREREFRSMGYPGDSHYWFGHEEEFSRRLQMTVEAWVYREDSTRTESVLSHGSISEGFFFGFASEKIRFGRSGGFAVLSEGDVPSGQWTHVAVSYDGSMARFYINGEGAGVLPLQHAGFSQTGPLRLAGGPGGGVLGFKGSLDEVRLWSEVRSAAELNSRRFVELDASSNEEDLELVFPIGSRIEVVMEDGPWADQVGSGLSLEYTGVLPRELVIPQASNHPKFDGNVDPRTEYAGAEELVMRYEDGPSFRDANAYLAHDGEFLYVGLEGVRLPAGGSPLSNNFLTIFLDPDGSSPRFDGELKRIRYRLNDGSATFSRLETEPFARWVEDPQLSVDFQALRGTERQGEFTSARDVEFRIRRSVMGDFHLDGFDRLAIVHENHGGPGGTSRAPNGALGSQPATWAEMRYTPRETGSLPHVDIEGIVVNPANGDGIEGVTVRLRGLNGEYAMRETNSAGRYSFVEYVGVGDPLRVVIDVPEGGQTGIPSVRSGGDVPTSISGAEVSYAGCEGEYCSYAHVVFRVRLPLPPTTILWFTPGEVYPEAVTRKFPDGKTAAGLPFHVEIANIHDDLTFYLLKDHCPNDPTVSPSCVEGVDYFRLEATRITPADGSPSYFELRIPGPSDGAPEVPFPGSYRLAAHDTWARPANNPTQPGSWRYAANRVAVVPPPYEDLHGFPFINIADGHDLTTYRAAFPDHVCNPLYMVGAWAYAPIYLSMAEGGQCVGMVVSANRLARGRSNLRPGSPLHTVHDDVLFGNGFRNADGFMGDGSWVPFPVRPSRYDVSNPCAPEPTNIWGRIKADHAVQFSSEYIGKLLEQFDLGEHGLVINHADVLEKIRFNPLRYQLCVRDGGKGHCVQPLRVIDTVIEEGVVQPHRHNIEVWDPNWPNRTRVIEVTIEPGQPGEYFYDAFGGGPWQGNWMFVYEIDPLWEGERHIPSIDTLAAALAQFGVTSIGQLLQLVISGDAEAMVSVPGHSAGWDGSGNFSETGEATLVIPPFNWLRTEEPPLGHLPANMIHRLEFGAPEVTVHNRGESYTFHSSHEGTMFQYFVNGAEDGTSDELAYLMEGELVTGVDFEAGGAGRSVNARVALCEDGGSYPAAMTFENLPVPLGTSVGISQLGNSAGVELRNDTGSSLSPLAKVIIPTSIQGGVEPEELDVPRTEVPAGASMRMMRAGGTGFEDLFIDIDHDRDGTPEFSYVFVGGNGEMVQTSPIFETRIEVTRVGSSVRITWRELPGWSLAFSADLENWSAVASVQIEDGMAVWSNDAMPEGGFFRLQRESPF